MTAESMEEDVMDPWEGIVAWTVDDENVWRAVYKRDIGEA
jgi:hypothetical protein